MAAAVNLDTVAAVRANGTELIRILSKGYPLCTVNVKELSPNPEEINTTAALARGVAARFAQLGCEVKGFDAYCESTVLPGSGLSSSATFEVLIGTVQTFVPFEILEDFRSGMDAVLGEGACHVLSIRPLGGVEMIT